MSQILTATTPHTTREFCQSDSSSEFSIKSNKERMKEFKTLCLERNSVMDHLLSCRRDKAISKQTSVLFHSQKWNLDPISSKNEKDELTKNTKFSSDNPFFQAKQKFYNKQKVSDKSGQIKNSSGEPLEDLELNNQRITFRRLLKKSSANQPLRGYLKKEQ